MSDQIQQAVLYGLERVAFKAWHVTSEPYYAACYGIRGPVGVVLDRFDRALGVSERFPVA